MRIPPGLRPLTHRNFALYIAGQFTSQFGNWVETTAVAWILYELTGSPILLGIGGLWRALPVLLLVVLGGAIADRLPRRKLLLVSESTTALLSLGVGLVVLAGRLEFWHLYILNLCVGTINALSVPARQAMFPEFVPREEMPAAVALNSVVVRLGGVLGPPVAGAALAMGGNAAPFLINALSFSVLVGALLLLRTGPTTAAVRPRVSLREGMAEGVSFVAGHGILKAILVLEVLTNMLGHNTALITLVARDWLGTGPEGLGLLLAGVSAGAFAGMLLNIAFPPKRRGRMMLLAGGFYCTCLALFGLSPTLALSLALVTGMGLADGLWSVSRNTLAQLVVPDDLRGRVMSLVVLSTRGSTPLGQLSSGLLASALGGPMTAIVGAVVIGAGLAVSNARVPQMRYAD